VVRRREKSGAEMPLRRGRALWEPLKRVSVALEAF
jgi:hypothetical protein